MHTPFAILALLFGLLASATCGETPAIIVDVSPNCIRCLGDPLAVSARLPCCEALPVIVTKVVISKADGCDPIPYILESPVTINSVTCTLITSIIINGEQYHKCRKYIVQCFSGELTVGNPACFQVRCPFDDCNLPTIKLCSCEERSVKPGDCVPLCLALRPCVDYGRVKLERVSVVAVKVGCESQAFEVFFQECFEIPPCAEGQIPLTVWKVGCEVPEGQYRLILSYVARIWECCEPRCSEQCSFVIVCVTAGGDHDDDYCNQGCGVLPIGCIEKPVLYIADPRPCYRIGSSIQLSAALPTRFDPCLSVRNFRLIHIYGECYQSELVASFEEAPKYWPWSKCFKVIEYLFECGEEGCNKFILKYEIGHGCEWRCEESCVELRVERGCGDCDCNRPRCRC